MRLPIRFASHIHVLNREVPFILNITVPSQDPAHPRLGSIQFDYRIFDVSWFRRLCANAEAGTRY